jgi:hypothetical protein
MRDANQDPRVTPLKNKEKLTLWNWLFTITPANTNSVDEITLLGLVSQTTSLVGTRRTGCTMYNVQLTIFPASTSIFTVSLGQGQLLIEINYEKKQRNSGQGYVPHTEQETEDIRLLFLVEFPNVFIGTHLESKFRFVCACLPTFWRIDRSVCGLLLVFIKKCRLKLETFRNV